MSAAVFLGTRFGDVSFDAVIDESPSSPATVTANPTETGAEINDHFYLNPVTLSMTVGVTNTPFGLKDSDIVSATNGLFGSSIGGSRSSAAWLALRAIQAQGKPFTVVTGLEVFDSMVITNLSAPRNAENAGSLICSVELRRVTLTGVKTAILTKEKLVEAVKVQAAVESVGKVPENKEKSKSWAASGFDAITGG